MLTLEDVDVPVGCSPMLRRLAWRNFPGLRGPCSLQLAPDELGQQGVSGQRLLASGHSMTAVRIMWSSAVTARRLNQRLLTQLQELDPLKDDRRWPNGRRLSMWEGLWSSLDPPTGRPVV